jgi:hypothetical protein
MILKTASVATACPEISVDDIGDVASSATVTPLPTGTTEVVAAAHDCPVVGLKPEVDVQPATVLVTAPVAHEAPDVTLKPEVEEHPGTIPVVVVVVVVDDDELPLIALRAARDLGPT